MDSVVVVVVTAVVVVVVVLVEVVVVVLIVVVVEVRQLETSSLQCVIRSRGAFDDPTRGHYLVITSSSSC